MSFDWNSFDAVRINVASWPPGESFKSGLVQTEWEIRTLHDLPAGAAALLGRASLERLSRDMSFDVHVLGPQLMGMTCFCPAEIPGPARLGAASMAWRFIDERVSRLWMIGEYPRAIFPEFMRQRRELVERISVSDRGTWLLLSLIRFEPLLSEMAGQPSQAEHLISILQGHKKRTALIDFFSGLRSGISVRTEDARTQGLKLGRILGVAIEFALRGLSDGSVDSMAYSTERLFDALFFLENSVDAGVSDGLSMEEDKAWFDDAVSLASFDGLSIDSVDRARSFCAQLANFCSQDKTQFVLMSEKLGQP
ncbi:hypothetical protein ACFXB3_10200 [Streptomyces sp. NPDC059447]|uniref:hypothetical protein n=1 Tax=Streptomyces sp. NPDC059447 TaxID=3346834 RepID=UPI0036759BB9